MIQENWCSSVFATCACAVLSECQISFALDHGAPFKHHYHPEIVYCIQSQTNHSHEDHWFTIHVMYKYTTNNSLKFNKIHINSIGLIYCQTLRRIMIKIDTKICSQQLYNYVGLI